MGDIQENIMTLKVYNILSREIKTVNINLPEESEDSAKVSLGILVREEEYPSAHERVLRIAEVYPKSPASFGGLMPLNDYIIDSPQYPFVNLEQFAGIVQAIEEKRDPKGLELCIYNAKTNSTRLTKIYPNKRWGGKGALGCEFSLGFLNFLPEVKEEEDIVIPRVNSHEINGNGSYEFEKINVVTIDDSIQSDDAKLYKSLAADEEKSNKLLKQIGEILQEKDQVKEKNPSAPTSYQNLLIETGNDSKNSFDPHDQQTTPIFELRSGFQDPITEDHTLEEHTSPDFPNRAFIKSPADSFDASRSQILIKPESSKPSTPKMGQANNHYHHNYHQVQKSSIRAMPRPQVRSRNTEASISHSISGISDISPITKISPNEHPHHGFNKKFFSSPGVHQRSTSFSGIQGISSPPSPHNLNSTIKEEVSVFYQSHTSTAKKPRRYTTDNKSHANAKNPHDEDIVETYFQGFERVEHLEDEPQGFPKILMINTQDNTHITTTILDRSGVESVNKSFDIMDTYEKPICKTVIQYAFQSKKLGGEYMIKSTDLFNIDDFIHKKL